MKKLTLIASFAVTAALSFSSAHQRLRGQPQVDCSQVMTELQAGKKVGEVAKDMKVSKSSVYAAARPPPRKRRLPNREFCGYGQSGAMMSPGATPASH